jgi:uncharacterized paraquat-inducible protein A
MKMTVFWKAVLCGLIEVTDISGLACCYSTVRFHALDLLVTLMMEAVNTSEISANFYETSQRNIPEDCHLHTHHHENLNSYNFMCI